MGALRVLSLVSLPTPEPVPILGWIHAFAHALAVVRFLQPLTAWQRTNGMAQIPDLLLQLHLFVVELERHRLQVVEAAQYTLMC